MFRADVVIGSAIAIAIVAPSLAQQAVESVRSATGVAALKQSKEMRLANNAAVPALSPPAAVTKRHQPQIRQRRSSHPRRSLREGVHAKTGMLYYSFHGRSQGAATKNYLASKPHGTSFKGRKFRAAAQTSWRLTYRTKFRKGPSSCQIVRIEVTVPIKYKMPRWLDYGWSSRRDQARWDRFYKRLFFHEKGHGTIALAGGRKLHEALAEIGEQPNCKLLREESRETLRNIRARTKRRQRAYDRRTNHGIRQGVGFPFRS